MIRSLHSEQRSDMMKLADNVQAWLRGECTPEADAGGMFMATLLECLHQIVVKE